MELRRRVLSGLYWSAGLRLLGQLFTWAITLVVIRLLTPADYGLMGLAGVFISFFSMISELGLGAAIVQRRHLEEAELSAIFGFVLFVNFVLCISLSAAAPLIADFYDEPQLVTIVWFLSLSFLLSGLAVIPRALLLKKQDHRTIAIIDLLAAVAGALTTLIVACNGGKVWALVTGVLSIRIVTTVGLQFARPYLQIPLIKFKGMRSIFTFSGNYTVCGILWYVHSSALAALIIGKVLGKEVLGIYETALYLACLPMEKVSGVINQVAFPAFSSVQGDLHLVATHFLKAVRIQFFILIPVFWGMSVLSSEIIGVFLGTKWTDAVIPFQAIAIIVPLRMIRNLMSPALFALGYSNVVFANEVVAVLIMSLACYVATWWGLIGVSLIWLYAFPAVFILNLPLASKALGIRTFDVYKVMIRPVMSGVAMVVCVELVRIRLIEHFSMLSRIVICVMVGGLAYIVVALIINRKGVKEVVGIIKP